MDVQTLPISASDSMRTQILLIKIPHPVRYGTEISVNIFIQITHGMTEIDVIMQITIIMFTLSKEEHPAEILETQVETGATLMVIVEVDVLARASAGSEPTT